MLWASGESPDCGGTTGFDVFFARLDRDGVVLSGPDRLSCGIDSSVSVRILWTGSEYAAFWVDSQGSRFHLTRIPADGSLRDRCGIELPTVGLSSDSGSPDFAWNGEVFGAIYHAQLGNPNDPLGNTDIFFERFDAEGTLLPPGAIRITDAPHKSWEPEIVWAGGEWGVLWKDERDNTSRITQVYFARLRADGVKLTPPGDVPLTGGPDTANDDHTWYALDWSGQEFGVVYSEDGPITGVQEMFFQRVAADGTLPEERFHVTNFNNPSGFTRHVVRWDGADYGVLWRDLDGPLRWSDVGCNCVDADGDLFNTCSGSDCDDGDPFAHPLAAEVCLSGRDDDCDSLADCQDETDCPAGPGTVPGAVVGVAFAADGETLVWDPEPSSDVYDLLTGGLTELAADGDFSRAHCLAWRVEAEAFTDTTPPAAGTGSYYLVRGKADVCRLGTWGSALRDAARPPNYGECLGIVTERNGTPLGGLPIVVTSSERRHSARTRTLGTGDYRVKGLHPGTYFVQIDRSVARLREEWGEVVLVPRRVRRGGPQVPTIEISRVGKARRLDLHTVKGGMICVRVHGATEGPLPVGRIRVFWGNDEDPVSLRSSSTDDELCSHALPPGEYYLLIGDRSTSYAPQWWPGVRTRDAAQTVELKPGSTNELEPLVVEPTGEVHFVLLSTPEGSRPDDVRIELARLTESGEAPGGKLVWELVDEDRMVARRDRQDPRKLRAEAHAVPVGHWAARASLIGEQRLRSSPEAIEVTTGSVVVVGLNPSPAPDGAR